MTQLKKEMKFGYNNGIGSIRPSTQTMPSRIKVEDYLIIQCAFKNLNSRI